MSRLRQLPPPGFTQRASRREALRLLGKSALRYLPCAGTDGYNDPFAVNPCSPFQQTLSQQNFCPILDDRGKPFNPKLGLDGIYGQHETWSTIADMLYFFLRDLPYEDLNLIVSSHFGQPVFLLAASGFRFRSVTFVGTPVRYDVGSERGIMNIGMAQCIYDKGFDLVGWLGSWFSGNVSGDRTFQHLGGRMKRYGYDKIGHIDVLHDQKLVQMWRSEPWLDNIRTAGQEAA